MEKVGGGCLGDPPCTQDIIAVAHILLYYKRRQGILTEKRGRAVLRSEERENAAGFVTWERSRSAGRARTPAARPCPLSRRERQAVAQPSAKGNRLSLGPRGQEAGRSRALPGHTVTWRPRGQDTESMIRCLFGMFALCMTCHHHPWLSPRSRLCTPEMGSTLSRVAPRCLHGRVNGPAGKVDQAIPGGSQALGLGCFGRLLSGFR